MFQCHSPRIATPFVIAKESVAFSARAFATRLVNDTEKVKPKASKKLQASKLTPNPSQWPNLLNLRNDDLRAIAFQTGINSSGTKSVLLDRLLSELAIPRLPSITTAESPHRTRILSIDMGIRNLAYCIIDVAYADTSSSSIVTAAQFTPSVQAWHRTSVQAASTLKEAFDPTHFATLAYDLVANALLPYKPSHVLIERQRYRSGGGHAVQEWTVRVNMFESMIHAVFRTLRQEHLRHAEHIAEDRRGGSLAVLPEVASVSPQKVARFYFAAAMGTDSPGLPDQQDGDNLQKRRTGKVEKAMKIQVVEDLLRGGLVVGDAVVQMKRAFLAARKPGKGTAARSRSKKNTQKMKPDNGNTHLNESKDDSDNAADMLIGPAHEILELSKLDDLADCLLQGLAWVKWEENRRNILARGFLESTKLITTDS